MDRVRLATPVPSNPYATLLTLCAAGVPRALACTLPRPHATAMKSPGGGSAHSGHGGGDWLLCRALAPLLGGNTSPHVLAVLADCRGTAATAVGAGGRSNLVPDGGGRGKGGGQELDVEFHKALELMAAAQCIRVSNG